MQMPDPTFALSPLDGRYANKLTDLQPLLSEYALVKNRAKVEIKWLIELANNPKIKELKPLSASQQKQLNLIWQNFSAKDAQAIKQIENKLLHDVKSLEMWLAKQMKKLDLQDYVSFIHFGCTSEDINNLAYGLMLKGASPLLQNELANIHKKLLFLADEYSSLAMTARTHGQEASPTTLGKEMAVFAYRLSVAMRTLDKLPINGKLNGATGNYNTWVLAYPKLDWLSLNKSFVEKTLGLAWNPYTTQIESHDALSELLSCLARTNLILVDLCRDLWGYISLNYLMLKKNEDEVGSSTMPHKINPEKFENAEGNLEFAASMASFLSLRLPVSRWQRDLSDSTLQRNLGSVFGYCLLGYRSCVAGLDRISANSTLISEDIEDRWPLLSEAVQTLMRQNKQSNSYDVIKRAVRGKQLDSDAYQRLVKKSVLGAEAQQKLLELTPASYLGHACKLAKDVKNYCK